ncbi:MAG TPA: alpha/beta fold hydrolase [Chloroflexota bacterium]|nr:alpha/beta fold hydrolase [Chloroflexota bacterium]
MPIVDSHGVPIHYEVAGDGAPIVLVHGFASSLQGNWGRTGWIDLLRAQGRQVVGLDCRGHGSSGKPHDSAAYDGHAMPEDVVAVMDAAGVGRADLMGYSMGGWISLNLLSRHPDRFRSAIIGGAGLRTAAAEPTRRNRLAEAMEAADPSTISDPIAAAFRRFAERNNNDLQALAALQRATRAPADEAALRSVQLPVLVVVGDADDALDGARRLADLVPDAELVTLASENHLSAVIAQGYKGAVGRFLERSSPVAA